VENNTKEQLIRNIWKGYAGQRVFESLALSGDQRRLARSEKDLIWERCRSSVPTMDGAIEVIRELSETMPLFIATTATRTYVEEILARETLAKTFRSIVTDSDVKYPKPAPEMLIKIAESLSALPSQLLFIGDSFTDYEMSKAAGSKFLLLDVHARFKREKANGEIAKSWQDIKTYLQSQLRKGKNEGSAFDIGQG
jgi:HAD superfamily hydrolase (TIGR01549 family)